MQKTIIQHEDDAFIVRRIFSRYATRAIGVRALRDELTGDGHWKRTGKPWTIQTLLHLLRNPVYTVKIRWKTALHDGIHEPIVEQAMFDRVQEVLKDRADYLKGRQWHTNSERLATGVIFCGLCGGHMVGVSATKNGRKLPYYVCNGRLIKSGWGMDYVRADHLESQIMSDFSGLFRTRAMVKRVWLAVNRLIAKERPDLETERAKVDRDLAKGEEQLDRYFAAFEDASMDPKACAPRVAALRRQVDALRGRQKRLADQLGRLQLPALDLDEVGRLLDYFEHGFESHSNAERKHLLHRLVKEVRVHSKVSAEVWFAFPRPQVRGGAFVDSQIWLRPLVSLQAA
jgi:site-specific DNA recombinase